MKPAPKRSRRRDEPSSATVARAFGGARAGEVEQAAQHSREHAGRARLDHPARLHARGHIALGPHPDRHDARGAIVADLHAGGERGLAVEAKILLDPKAHRLAIDPGPAGARDAQREHVAAHVRGALADPPAPHGRVGARSRPLVAALAGQADEARTELLAEVRGHHVDEQRARVVEWRDAAVAGLGALAARAGALGAGVIAAARGRGGARRGPASGSGETQEKKRDAVHGAHGRGRVPTKSAGWRFGRGTASARAFFPGRMG